MVVCYLVIRISVSFQLGVQRHRLCGRQHRQASFCTTSRTGPNAKPSSTRGTASLPGLRYRTKTTNWYVPQHAHPNTGFAAPFSKVVLGSVLLKHWLSGSLPPRWFLSLCCLAFKVFRVCVVKALAFRLPSSKVVLEFVLSEYWLSVCVVKVLAFRPPSPKVVLEFVLSPHWLSGRLPPKWFWSLCCQSTGFPAPLQSGFRVCVVKVLDFQL